jgi:hypothetical protein
MDRHAPIAVSVSHGMPSALGSVEPQRYRGAIAHKVAPPRLGVGHVCGDVDIVTAAAICHRDTERPERRPV